MILFQLACKNLLLQKKRYMLMTLAIALGFFLMTVLSALTQGAIDTIRAKAARYFSGQVCLYGFKDNERYIQNPDLYIALLEEASLSVESIAKRSVLYSSYDATIFFNGSYVSVRRTIGVNFDAERKQLEKLPFTSGGIGDGLLVSRTLTDDIGAQVGDNVIFSITTSTGQINTLTVPIAGIFDELNLFGYSVYLSQDSVNTLALLPDGYTSEIAIYTKKGASISQVEDNIIASLSEHAEVYPKITTRQQYIDLLDSVEEGKDHPLVAVTIDAQLEEISLILQAFEICAYIILVVFMLITAIGIVNTYRVIIFNRVGEIGTMRALGIQKNTVLRLFLLEALLLSFVASVIGFLLAIVTLLLTNVFTLTGSPAVSMFTEYSRLQYSIQFQNTIFNLFLIVISVFLAVLRPTIQAATVSPAEALRKI